MNKTVVLTGVGRDKVGIVAELTNALYELNCNLLDSSMTLLRGEFAVILMVSLPDNVSTDVLKGKLQAVEKRVGFTMHVRELSGEEAKIGSEEGKSLIISVYGADKTGIVTGITKKIAELGLNITDLETQQSGAAKSGSSSRTKPIFLMILEVTGPASTSVEKVAAELKEVGKRLGVDVTVQEMEVMEL